MKKETLLQVIKHGEDLNNIFHTDIEDVLLCKKLRRLETDLNRKAVDYCNGDVTTEDWEEITIKYLAKLDKLLGYLEKKIPIFINDDPRGYQIKVKDSYVRDKQVQIYRDWGGYGIIAPDFN